MTKTVTVQAQQKWEYCYLTRKTEGPLLAELNVLGQEGWEMITLIYYKDLKGAMEWTAFLKRPSTGEGPKPAGQAAPAVFQPSDAPAKATPAPGAGLQGFDLSDEEFKMEE